MRHLCLLRHAKSGWNTSVQHDHDRPLAERGFRDAPRMAEYIAANLPKPGLVVCSTALRTRQTLACIQETLTIANEDIVFDGEIYEAHPAALLWRIRRLPDEKTSVLIIGHNPGMQHVALELAATGASNSIAQLSTKFPTTAVAWLSLPRAPWAETARRSGHLELFMTPRGLPD